MPHNDNSNINCKSDPMGDGKNFEDEVYRGYKSRIRSQVDSTTTDIYYALGDTVVSIQSFFPATISQNQERCEPIDNTCSKYKVGSGFFVDNGVIVTAAHVVTRVLGTIGDPIHSNYGYARASEIRVRVKNVNQKGEAYYYDAEIMGVSGYFDLAVLKIKKPRDCSVPIIKSHAILKWGNSRHYAIGEPVYVLGDSYREQTVGISEGILSDNMSCYHGSISDANLKASGEPEPGAVGLLGQVGFQFEAIIADAQSNRGNAGGPMIDRNGYVIGVIVGQQVVETPGNLRFAKFSDPFTLGDDSQYYGRGSLKTVGVSEYVARYVSDVIRKGPADRCTGSHLGLCRSPYGNFYRFDFGYLGITDYLVNGFEVARILDLGGYKVQKGIFLTGYDSDASISVLFGSNGPIYNIEGNLFANEMDPIDGFSGIYGESILVTRINGTPIGAAAGQIHISSLLMLHVAGEKVQLDYRMGSEGWNCPHAMQFELTNIPVEQDLPPEFGIRLASNFGPHECLEAPDNREVNDTLLTPDNIRILSKIISASPELFKLIAVTNKITERKDVEQVVIRSTVTTKKDVPQAPDWNVIVGPSKTFPQ